MANPDWTKDEHILALDVYLRLGKATNDKQHPDIQELSRILKLLPVHPEEVKDSSFRNPAGVYMKLQNFKRCDPGYPGVGLQRGAKLEEEVWREYAHQPEKLREVALAIRNNYSRVDHQSIEAETVDNEEASEGRILTVTHKRRERDPKIVQSKKEKVLKENGALECEVCNFNFEKNYGEIGSGFIECHHDKPLSKMMLGEKTLLSDLRLVCANCHRMLHRTPWRTVDELKLQLNTASKKKGKLVRDKIPEIIKADGRSPIIKQLRDEALRAALEEKLAEEYGEYNRANKSADRIEELADIIEVCFGIAATYGSSRKELLEAADSKKEKRGGFCGGYFYVGDDS